jgi:hypothetical protein
MLGMPRWLLKVLKADEVSGLYQEADIVCNDLAACIMAVRTIAGSPETETPTLGIEQEKFVAEATTYLDSIPAMTHWHRFAQRKHLRQLIADLTAHMGTLANMVLPYLDPFVDDLLQKCETGLEDLLGLRRRRWDISGMWHALYGARARLEMVRNLSTPDSILTAYVIQLQAHQALDAIQRTHDQESKNREVSKLLARLRSEYKGRKCRLTTQFERLNRFQSDCASWQDIEPLLNEASNLLAGLVAGFAKLQALIDRGETAAATSLGATLQANFDRVKVLCDESEQTRMDRRKQLDEASATATNQLRRAWKIAREHGNAKRNESLQQIQAFVRAYRQAVKDSGDLLTVDAIAEQAQAIVPAVDAFQADPTATIGIAVQKEFAELGCFPE